ncbi:MAG: hypothetical protein ACK55I_07805, partial [bacterium]
MLRLLDGILTVQRRCICTDFRHALRMSRKRQPPCHDADIPIDRRSTNLAHQGRERIQLRSGTD